MPLGLAKDSMLNLAELANQKEDSDGNPLNESSSNNKLSLEDGEDETLVMRLATHEIETVESMEEEVRNQMEDDPLGDECDDPTASTSIPESNGHHHHQYHAPQQQQQEQAPGLLELESPKEVNSAPETSGEADHETSSLETRNTPTQPISAASKSSENRALSERETVNSTEDSSVHSESPSELTEKTNPQASSVPAEDALVTIKEKPQTSYGTYEGFNNDYSEYEHYGNYSLAAGTPTLLLGQKYPSDQQSFWCCLFPWLTNSNSLPPTEDSSEVQEADGDESTVEVNGSQHRRPYSRSNSKEDDETSTGSDAFGEKLSEKDRQAVLARLRLASPDATETAGPANANGNGNASTKGLLNGLATVDLNNNNNEENSSASELKRKMTRGILKQTSSLSRTNLKAASLRDSGNPSGSGSTDGNGKRRSLFPAYEPMTKNDKNLKTEFSPMARVLTVKSHKDMDEEEKAAIWWQRSDYEEFRKTGRMITKAMLQGGSEIWLATNQSWQLPNKDRQSTLKLAEHQAAFHKGDVKAKQEYEDTRDKWWHKFGHSRRGLEHIASIDEGRQRQSNVRTAIRAVIEEQRRQKVFHREDADKLRMVSIQHTSWARDLAMAAGASDADAVNQNFDDESRKSREFYLLKFSRSNQMTVTSTSKANVPAFMKPALAMKVAQPSRLDANTVPQIRFRQTQKKRGSVAPTTSGGPTMSTTKAEAVPIRTADGDGHGGKMAKQAAGFASGEEVGNMSAVLTGMGPIPVAGR